MVSGATLYGRGRDVEEIEAAVEFNRNTCRWRILGAASDVRRTDERGAILTALEQAQEPMSPADVALATEMRSLNVRQLLFKMTKAGEVLKLKGRGGYIHPSRTDLRPPDNIDNKITNLDDYRGKKGGDDE